MAFEETARLVWKSKPKREPSPKDLEFQTAEIVLPTLVKPLGEGMLEFPKTAEGEPDVSRMNRLIWGDNLLVMQALLAQGYEGKISLIYIDPPFWTGDNFTMKVHLPKEAGLGDVKKGPTPVERLAYMDTWSRGVDSYLDMLYPRLVLMRKLLADTGSIYVHLDWHVGHYVKVMMDEIFGYENFRNEIVWCYRTMQTTKSTWARKHDIILFYSKTSNFIFNLDEVLDPYPESYSKRFKYIDEQGRRFMIRGKGGPFGVGQGDISIEDEKKYPQYTYRQYMQKGSIPKDWWEIDMLNSMDPERVQFDTQKPEALLKRIILASSNPGDIVADFFCGSGTTLAVAEKLGRRWIGSDLSKLAIQVSRCRLVHQGAKPFVIENIGNYQKELIYLEKMNLKKMYRLVMKLIGARQREDHPELGILSAGTEQVLVYVGHPDRPVTAKMLEEKAKLTRTLDGRGYNKLIVFGWEYEPNFEERWRSRKVPGFEVEFRLIPNEIFEYMKRNRSEEDWENLAGKIEFFEKPYLNIERPKVVSRRDGEVEVEVSLSRYVMKDFPKVITRREDAAEVRRQLQEIEQRNWAALIDWWAVDYDYDGRTFVCRWQTHRGFGKRMKEVPTTARFRLECRPIRYNIAVRVVDIFGNDATATTDINLRE